MTDNRSMPELKIRYVPDEVKVKLKRQAKLRGLSLQQYLYENIIKLSDSNGILEYERQLKEEREVLQAALERNTKVIQSFIEEYGGD